jgi:hypothetical protein
LDQWGGDFGFKFYYQPKIDFKIKNYSIDNSTPVLKTISEGIKLINLTSTSTTLKNLNALFDSTNSKYDASLQKVVESLSETATLEGTRKTNVITPIRREARTFDSAAASLNFKIANVLPPSYLSSFYGNDPSLDDTIIGGTLSIYDPQLRDIYHLWKGNYKALGIPDSINSYRILNTDSIISQLDFLLTFGPELGSDPSKLLSNYVILLAIYDEGKHSLIKDWEKSIMSEYYGQYYMLGSRNEEITSCNNLSTFSISYSTVPQSESYVGNQLPFANLLYGQFGKGSLPNYGTQKYNPIFKGENAFDAGNESRYKTFSESIVDYESSKALTIINLKDNPKAKVALFSCLGENASFIEFSNFIDTNNVSLILAKKIGSAISNISNIQISATANTANTSVFKIGTKTIASADNKKTCPKTVCEQTLAEAVCGDGDSNTTVNEADTGFNSTNARKITISSSTSSCDLILPVSSTYTYAETKNTNSTITLAAATYVLGTPPRYESENVMSHEVIDNTVPEILTQYVAAMEEPNSNPTGLSMMVLYSAMSKNGEKLVLTGDGADEIFCGYDRYKKASQISLLPQFGMSIIAKTNKWKHFIPKTIQNLMVAIEPANSDEFWLFWHSITAGQNLNKLYPYEAKIEMESIGGKTLNTLYGNGSRTSELMVKDLFIWLSMESNRKLDRISMWNSIEARSPFQSERMIAKAFIKMKQTNFKVADKYFLKQSINEYATLPILKNKKGFISPLGHWIRSNPDMVLDSLEHLKHLPFFDKKSLDELKKSVYKNDYRDFKLVWSLVVFSYWLKYAGNKI